MDGVEEFEVLNVCMVCLGCVSLFLRDPHTLSGDCVRCDSYPSKQI